MNVRTLAAAAFALAAPLALTAAAQATTATSGDIGAAQVTILDSSDDVKIVDASLPKEKGAAASIDLGAVAYSVSDGAADPTLNIVYDIHKVARFSYYKQIFATKKIETAVPGDDTTVTLYSRSSGPVRVSTGSGEAAKCKGAKVSVDKKNDVVTQVVPLRCLVDPHTVTLKSTVGAVVVEEQDNFDDAMALDAAPKATGIVIKAVQD